MIHYAYQLCSALAAEGASVTLVTARDYELSAFPHNFAVEKQMKLWTPFDPTSAQPRRGRLARAWRKLSWMARRAQRGLRFVIEWIRLTNFLLKQRPDLVQFGRINFPFEALFLAYLKRRGLILSQICHEFELREQSGRSLASLANRLYIGVYPHFAAIFLHGETNRQSFLSLFPVPIERTHVISFGNEGFFLSAAAKLATGLDLRQRYGLAEDEPVVLFFGTLTPSKGLPELMRAFSIIREGNHRRVRLIVAGFPTKHINMQELQRLAADLGIIDQVIFDTRYIPFEEVGALMELASVVVYPYRNSTQSAALQVAYAFGRPVVATRVGGLPEAVEDGRSGFLVSPQAPEELAAAILKILDDPQLAAQLGAYARHLSETQHSWMPIARQLLAVYRGLLRPDKHS
jgi:glycosyltransferase involved in cell wall biosynthesis